MSYRSLRSSLNRFKKEEAFVRNNVTWTTVKNNFARSKNVIANTRNRTLLYNLFALWFKPPDSILLWKRMQNVYLFGVNNVQQVHWKAFKKGFFLLK